jgi:two-component system NtrC family sensor kinase
MSERGSLEDDEGRDAMSNRRSTAAAARGLAGLALEVGRIGELPEAWGIALRAALGALEAEAGAILLAGGEGRPPRLVADHGLRPEAREALVHAGPATALLDEVRRTGEPVLVADLARDPALAELVGRVAAGRPRSLAAIPLWARDECLGFLVALAPMGRRPAEANGEFLAAVGHQLGLALDQARLLREWAAEARQVSVLNEVATLLTSGLGLDEITAAFAAEVARLVEFDHISLALHAEAPGVIRLSDLQSLPRPAERRTIELPGEATAFPQVLAAGTARVEARLEAEAAFAEQRLLAEAGMRSLVYVPLLTDGRAIGTLNVASRRPAAYDAGAVALLAQLAKPLASAIERGRLLDRTQQHLRQLTTLRAVVEAISGELELESLLRKVIASAVELLEASGGLVYLREPGSDLARCKAVHNLPDALLGLEIRRGGPGMTGRVLETGEPIALDRYGEVPAPFPGLADLAEAPSVCVPIWWQGEVIGTFAINARDRRRTFDARDIETLSLFAKHAGIAIANARLYESVRRAERQTGTILDMTRALGASLNLDEVLQRAVTALAAATGVPDCALYLLDPAGKELLPKVLTPNAERPMLRQEFFAHPLPLDRPSAIREAFAEKAPVTVFDAALDPRTNKAIVHRIGLKSHLAVPLVAGGKAVGVAVVATFDRNHRFTEDQVAVAMGIAHSVAIAIENARLYGEAQAERRHLAIARETLAAQIANCTQRNRELLALKELSEAVIAHPDLDRLLATTAEMVAASLAVRTCAVLLPDEDGALRIRAHVGLRPEGLAGVAFRPEEGIQGKVFAGGIPAIVNNPGAAPLARPDFVAHQAIARFMAVPLKARDRTIGVMTVSDKRSGQEFTEEDLRLLWTFGNHVALGIENARLHDRAQQDLRKLDSLRAVVESISAELDLDTLLHKMIVSAGELLGAENGSVALWDEAAGVGRIRAVHHLPPAALGLEVGPGAGLAGRVIAERAPVIVDRYGDIEATLPALAELAECPAVGVPILWRDRLVGTLAVGAGAPGRRFDAGDAEVLGLFAKHAAIAIQNARLLGRERDHARRLQTVTEVGRKITTILEIERVLAETVSLISESFGYSHVAVLLLDPQDPTLLYQAARSPGAFQAPPDYRQPLGRGMIGWAAARGQTALANDAPNDPRFMAQAGVPTLSELAIPLRVGGRVTGVLNIESDRRGAFAEEDVPVLEILADQIAIAIENARLYSSIRDYSEGLEEIVRRRTEDLEREKQFAEAVFEALPIGLFVIDRSYKVVACNTRGERELCFEEGPLRGWNLLDLLPSEWRGAARAAIDEIFETGRLARDEKELSEAGDRRVLRLTRAPLALRGGSTEHVILLLEDVTERRRLERQVLVNEKLAAVGQLAGGVAHELNNPLATIAGCAEALLGRATDPSLAGLEPFRDFPDYLTLIEEEAYRCKEITGNLLQFVREPGPKRERHDLNALVEQAVTLVGHQPRFRQLAVVKQLDPDLPPVEINEGQIRQVFLAIMLNALDATEGAGTLTIRTARRREADGDRVAIEFQDTGSGIPESLLTKIFEPFFTTKPPGKGTGLGLSICHGIVSEHGGRIDVASQVGRGSTFRVVLPIPGPEPEAEK